LDTKLETVACPYCQSADHSVWALEKGFATVKCLQCDFLFLNPRPSQDSRDMATQLGYHDAAANMDISESYLPKKTERYKKILAEMFGQEFSQGAPISWIDIGAGYGETMDAVKAIAPPGSTVNGVEPMKPKAEASKARGLSVYQQALGPGLPVCDYASLVDVFSHINDFDDFLQQIRNVIKDGGEFFMETGHLDGRIDREDFPGELGSPDHVTFASQRHITGFLERNGFEIITIRADPIDGWLFSAKNLVKKLIGRDVSVKMPYSSSYRTLLIRARKLPA
jgi:SAM-dependent methyltransferase